MAVNLLRTDAPALTGRRLAHAFPPTDEFGHPAIEFGFDPIGSKAFEDLTDRHRGWSLAIILAGVLREAPVIQDCIAGSGIISGHFTQAQANNLTATLQKRARKGD